MFGCRTVAKSWVFVLFFAFGQQSYCNLEYIVNKLRTLVCMCVCMSPLCSLGCLCCFFLLLVNRWILAAMVYIVNKLRTLVCICVWMSHRLRDVVPLVDFWMIPKRMMCAMEDDLNCWAIFLTSPCIRALAILWFAQ